METAVISFHPVKASAGGDNAFTLDFCSTVEHQPQYAACIRKIERGEQGWPAPTAKLCYAAMEHNTCQAARMRKEEVLEGKSLYYKPRAGQLSGNATRDADSAQRSLAKFGLGDIPPEKPNKHKRRSVIAGAEPAPAAPASVDFAAGLAIAINKVAAASSEPHVISAPRPTQPGDTLPRDLVKPKNTAKPGETMLETARRLAGHAKP